MSRYLKITEDGEIQQIEEISTEDHEEVEGGIADVIWFHQGKYKRMEIGPAGGRYWTEV